MLIFRVCTITETLDTCTVGEIDENKRENPKTEYEGIRI